MNKLAKVLPAKKEYRGVPCGCVECLQIESYNQSCDDHRAAIERANLVVCPSEEELTKTIFDTLGTTLSWFHCEALAKAIRELMIKGNNETR